MTRGQKDPGADQFRAGLFWPLRGGRACPLAQNLLVALITRLNAGGLLPRRREIGEGMSATRVPKVPPAGTLGSPVPTTLSSASPIGEWRRRSRGRKPAEWAVGDAAADFCPGFPDYLRGRWDAVCCRFDRHRFGELVDDSADADAREAASHRWQRPVRLCPPLAVCGAYPPSREVAHHETGSDPGQRPPFSASILSW